MYDSIYTVYLNDSEADFDVVRDCLDLIRISPISSLNKYFVSLNVHNHLCLDDNIRNRISSNEEYHKRINRELALVERYKEIV